MSESRTLQEAEVEIEKNLPSPQIERIPLATAYSRVAAAPVYSLCPSPAFSRSAYDGFALAQSPVEVVQDHAVYRIMGEISAGNRERTTMASGEAYRIMTGAPLPAGACSVVRQECCQVNKNRLLVPSVDLLSTDSGIQERGSYFPQGKLLHETGLPFSCSGMGLLAEAGVEELEVFSRAKVAFFCTGSELVDSLAQQKQGLTLSSNRILLTALLKQYGAEVHDLGLVADSCDEVVRKIDTARDLGCQLIFSTGGMGPGKYDLVGKSFSRAGGKAIVSSLQVRPGKSTLVGTLLGSLYFGLPGPPFAVLALFHILVLPALDGISGLKNRRPRRLEARLDADLRRPKSEVLSLQPALFAFMNGCCHVRHCADPWQANSLLFFPAKRETLRAGEMVTLQPLLGTAF